MIAAPRTVSALTLLLLLVVTPPLPAAETNRPARWAQPVSANGLPNLHRITPTLYRSAQPAAAGFKELQKLGIRTVINLRAFHSDEDELEESGSARDAGIALERIKIKTWKPEEEHILRFLKIVTDPAREPILFHCQHGADRTGTLCAIYRIVVQGWTKEDAIQEMTDGGYNFHAIWTNLISFIRELDVDAIRRKAGLAAPPPLPPDDANGQEIRPPPGKSPAAGSF